MYVNAQGNADVSPFEQGVETIKGTDRVLTQIAAQENLEVFLITKVVQWLLGISATLALLVLVIGGIVYIISFGDEKRTQAAKRVIIYAIIGLIVIGLSFAILGIIDDFFRGAAVS